MLTWIDISVSTEKENFKEYFLNSVILGAKKTRDLLFCLKQQKIISFEYFRFHYISLYSCSFPTKEQAE